MAAPTAVDSRAETTRALGPRAAAVGDAPEGNSLAVSLEALLHYIPPAIVDERNPFRFGPAPYGNPDAFRRSESASVEPDSAERAEPSPAAAALTAYPALEPTGDTLRFIGRVAAPDRRRVAVLADEAGVYHGGVDDVVAGRYRIVAVSETSLQLDDIPRGIRVMLQLGGAGGRQR